jgi:hypothetical protein
MGLDRELALRPHCAPKFVGLSPVTDFPGELKSIIYYTLCETREPVSKMSLVFFFAFPGIPPAD